MRYSQLGVFDPNFVRETIQKQEHKPIPAKGMTISSAFGEQFRLEPGIVFSKTPG